MNRRQNLFCAAYIIATLGMSHSTAAAGRDVGKFQMTVAPADGNDADVNLVVSYATADRAAPQQARVLINSAIDGRNACYVFYSDDEKAFRLVKNSGEGSFTSPVPGAGKLENTQCRLDVGRSSAVFRDGVLKLELALHFKSPFSGFQNIYLWMRSAKGEESGFHTRGKWLVPHGLFLQGTTN